MDVEHGVVESKCLQVCPGGRVTLRVRKDRRRTEGWKLDARVHPLGALLAGLSAGESCRPWSSASFRVSV